MKGFSPNGKYFICSGPEDCCCWNVADWSLVFHIEERVDIIHGPRRKLMGIRHDDKIRLWSDEIISEYNDEFELEEEVQESGAN